MCGINGIFSPEGGLDAQAPRHIARMNALLAHRGPDDEGVWGDPGAGIWLGHRRLSILDLSARGHQPMVGPDGTAIVFNGEIYNFRELRRTHLADCRFHSNSDTETVLALYRRKGQACLDDLVGMFAFAIWDPAKRGLFLARDRIGKKPLYYTCVGGYFAFSSEIRALLALPWVKREMDDKASYQFLTFGFVPPPLTMFKGIRKLEPGYRLWVDGNRMVGPEPYWEINREPVPTGETELAGALRQRMERSVDLRMVSDVPVGLFLSGGVDSSGLAALMRQRSDGPIHSFSISFADQPDYDEAQAARATAERLGLDHHERVVTRDDMRAMIREIADVLDEPLADPTCIPIYFLSAMAREAGVKVVLTGDGPDELFLGYRNWARYRRAYPWFRAYGRLPVVVRKAGLHVAKRFSSSPRLVEMFQRASRGQELFWGSAPSFRESEKGGLLSADFAERAREWDTHDEIAALRADYERFAHDERERDRDANWMAYVGLRFNIPNFYLHRADRLGMRHSVELRAPWLDHGLVNFALSIPAHWKVKGGEPKAILKRALKGVVPDDTLYAAKKGFCVPLREWGGDVMVEGVMGGLDLVCGKLGLFDRTALEKQVKQFRKGDAGLVNNLWVLFFLIAWIERWMETGEGDKQDNI